MAGVVVVQFSINNEARSLAVEGNLAIAHRRKILSKHLRPGFSSKGNCCRDLSILFHFAFKQPSHVLRLVKNTDSAMS